MVEIVFRRRSAVNANGSVPGTLTIGAKSWPTIERGGPYTFVRKGEYTVKMDIKNTGRRIRCLRFDHDGIRTHLIHDSLNDNHRNLLGCISPGKTASNTGVTDSEEAMREVFQALGGFEQSLTKTITVENNIRGDETGEAWMRRRREAGKY
jgi:hypothetical protein